MGAATEVQQVVCTICDQPKNPNEFYERAPGRLRKECKTCRKLRSQAAKTARLSGNPLPRRKATKISLFGTVEERRAYHNGRNHTLLGETDVLWDNQETDTKDNERVFIDTDYNECKESDLELSEGDEDEEDEED